MSWLLSDQASWRDLLWLPVNTVVGSLLLLVPLLLFGSGIVAFIIPALGALPWFYGLQHLVPPPAFPGNTPLVLFIVGARHGRRRRLDRSAAAARLRRPGPAGTRPVGAGRA